MKAVCIMSGGMDSTLCAAMAKREGYEIIGLHFDYNQRTMGRERRAFEEICKRLKISQKMILDVSFIADIGGNSLTDVNLKVRKDGINNEIPNTYVPFRNGIFISIAAAVAEKNEADTIFIGVVEEDSSGYPDCTKEFILNAQNAINLGTAIKKSIKIITPLVNLSKEQIVAKSLEFGSPLELTWSCYESSDLACGFCDSCRLRLKGFEMVNAKDPIKYKI